jgi:hypothetical protein
MNKVENLVVVSMEDLVREWENQLPPWAIRHAIGNVLEVGTQLPTKDGRRMGNAHIIEITQSPLGAMGRQYYVVLTDAGSKMVMNSSEIAECFHPPRYVADVNEVLRKFQQSEQEE